MASMVTGGTSDAAPSIEHYLDILLAGRSGPCPAALGSDRACRQGRPLPPAPPRLAPDAQTRAHRPSPATASRPGCRRSGAPIVAEQVAPSKEPRGISKVTSRASPSPPSSAVTPCASCRAAEPPQLRADVKERRKVIHNCAACLWTTDHSKPVNPGVWSVVSCCVLRKKNAGRPIMHPPA